MNTITTEDVENWLGTDNPEQEAIDIITEIANGRYSMSMLVNDILDYKRGDK